MNNMTTDFRQRAVDYWHMVPKCRKELMISFAVAGLIRLATTQDLSLACMTGALAASATAIHALAAPLFRNVLQKIRLSWEEEMCRTIVILIGVGSVASAYGDMSVLNNLFGLTILYGLWNYLEPTRRDTDRASAFGFMPVGFRV